MVVSARKIHDKFNIIPTLTMLKLKDLLIHAMQLHTSRVTEWNSLTMLPSSADIKQIMTSTEPTFLSSQEECMVRQIKYSSKDTQSTSILTLMVSSKYKQEPHPHRFNQLTPLI